MAEAADGGGAFVGTLRVRRADGRAGVLRVAGRPFPGRSGGGRWLHGVVVDVTEAAVEPDRAAELEARARLALDASGAGVWEWDLGTGRSKWPAFVREALGLGDSLELADAAVATRALHPDDFERLHVLASERILAGATFTDEVRVRVPGGGWRWLRVAGAAVRDAEGVPQKLVGVLSDVTATRKTVRQLERALEEARQASEAKSRFVASVSHELRTPLHAVVGVATLLSEAGLAPEQRELLDILHDATRGLLRLIDDLLDLRRAELGKLEVVRAPFRLRDLLERVARLHAGTASARGLSLRLEAPIARDVEVVGDADRLEQVLTNLVGNALKFTAVGHVAVSAALEPIPSLRAARLVVRVCDTGGGVPDAERAHVFEPFFRGADAERRTSGGIGLGLAISRQIVERMGGGCCWRRAMVWAPAFGWTSRSGSPTRRRGPRRARSRRCRTSRCTCSSSRTSRSTSRLRRRCWPISAARRRWRAPGRPR